MSDLQVLLLSPYHGKSSHGAWGNGYAQNSRHDVQLLTLPDRFWKWRMHGGAVTLARRFMESNIEPDLILATDMLDLSTFAALTRQKTAQVPMVLYMHENQLTYPLPKNKKKGAMRRQKGERDHHYVFVNYVSGLTAVHTLFNSHYHRQSWLEALPNFLKHFPEYNELGTVAQWQKNSSVLPVGINLQRLNTSSANADNQPSSPPLILWNQRWEYDKNPAQFFETLYKIKADGIPFRLALCGQRFGREMGVFGEAQERLADELVHVGFADSDTYRQLLWQADVVVSTAVHEFFGISIIEAIYTHTFPVLPHRLSYPELLPEAHHLQCLYQNEGELLQRLRWALTHPAEARTIAQQIAPHVAQFDWQKVAPRYDAFLSSIQMQGSNG